MATVPVKTRDILCVSECLVGAIRARRCSVYRGLGRDKTRAARIVDGSPVLIASRDGARGRAPARP